MQSFPKKRGYVYTTSIALRLEPELKEVFEWIKNNTELDVPEAQRQVLRDLAKKLKDQVYEAS